MKKRFGFTLVELLVVISIMSILSVITFSQFENGKRKARDNQRKTDLDNLSKSIGMYFTDYGVYPPDTGGRVNGVSWGGEFVDTDGYVYQKQLPRESYLSSYPYCYDVDATGKMFAMYAKIENTEDSTYQSNLTCDSTGVSGYTYVIYSPNAGPSDF